MDIFRRTTITISIILSAFWMIPGMALAKTNDQVIPGESNLGFLLAGLAIAWAVFFIYVLYLAKRTREVGREIEEVRRRLAPKN